MDEQMKTPQDLQTWRDMKMIDADGGKIGTIEDIFLDCHTGEPAWGGGEDGAVRDNEVRVGLQKENVKDAPRVDAKGD